MTTRPLTQCALVMGSVLAFCAVLAQGEEGSANRKGIDEHPLTSLVEYAKSQHDFVKQNVRDYTCRIVKREMINGKMQAYRYMNAKVRASRLGPSESIPFAAYVKYLKPKSVAGQEVQYIAGKNDGKMLVRRRQGGPTFRLGLKSPRALRESTIPISDLSFDKMLEDTVAQLERDMEVDPRGENTQAEIVKGARINGRPCTAITVTHPRRHKELGFHKVRMFIDDQWRMPTRLEVYDWPLLEDGESVLIREFTYLDLKINVNLSNDAFRVLVAPESASND